MHHWPETNESLILRVKDPADAASWSDFLSIYRPVVVRMACGRGLQHADADDLAQQVFLSVAKAIEAWEPDAHQPPFRVWLSRITRDAIVNTLTRRKPDAPGGSTSVQEMLRALHPRRFVKYHLNWATLIAQSQPGIQFRIQLDNFEPTLKWNAKQTFF